MTSFLMEEPAMADPVVTTAPPEYIDELAAFHEAFHAELRAVVGALPLNPHMRVLDVGCGDGFHSSLIAERLSAPGGVVGLDSNAGCLELARRRVESQERDCEIAFVQGDLSNLPLQDRFDFVWCAQSLYSLPEPIAALKQMAAALRPGGTIVVLENDTLHQLLLPWPPRLELALRAGEYAALAAETARPGKFYVGRRLPALFAAAGLVPLGFRTQCIDRSVPLDRPLESFLQAYLGRLAERVGAHVPAALAEEFASLIDPSGPGYLLRQPNFTMTWVNVLAWGRVNTAAD